MKPTPAQLQAIQSTNEKVFAIAGPGSGKTRTLIWRIEHLVRKDFQPHHIACITFTNAGAREMQKRLRDSGITVGFVGTLHAFILDLIRKHGLLIGYQGTFTILDEVSEEVFLEEIINKHRWKGSKSALLEAIAQGPASPESKLRPVDVVAAGWWKELRSARLLTFDSILILGERLLVAMETKMVPIHFAHYLIDEVQDSSPIDFRIYNLLDGDKFLVGDPDQSIFGFRGADVAQCVALTRDPEWQTIAIEGNFRSGSAICEAAHRLIEHNTDRFAKQTISAVDFAACVEVKAFDNSNLEGAYIAKEISELSCGKCLDDFAVLVPTNDLVRLYSDILRSHSIPIAEKSRVTMPADWKLARACLDYLLHPDNDYAAQLCCTMLNGEVDAAKAKSKAMKEFCSFNAAWLNIRPVQLDEVSAFRSQFKRFGISEESMELILDTRGTLPLGARPDALLLALRNEDTSRGDGVTVSTIHGAKGLEWGCVFLAAFEQQNIPSERASLNLPEQRRLAYVGLTRAKAVAYITYCRMRQQKWLPRPVPVQPSQFLAEMGVKL